MLAKSRGNNEYRSKRITVRQASVGAEKPSSRMTNNDDLVRRDFDDTSGNFLIEETGDDESSNNRQENSIKSKIEATDVFYISSQQEQESSLAPKRPSRRYTKRRSSLTTEELFQKRRESTTDKFESEVSMTMSRLFQHQQSIGESSVQENPQHGDTKLPLSSSSSKNSSTNSHKSQGKPSFKRADDDPSNSNSSSTPYRQQSAGNARRQSYITSGNSSTIDGRASHLLSSSALSRRSLMQKGEEAMMRRKSSGGSVPGAFHATGRAFGENPIWGERRTSSIFSSFGASVSTEESDFDPLFSDDENYGNEVDPLNTERSLELQTSQDRHENSIERDISIRTEVRLPNEANLRNNISVGRRLKGLFGILSDSKTRRVFRQLMLLILILCICIGAGVGITKIFVHRRAGLNNGDMQEQSRESTGYLHQQCNSNASEIIISSTVTFDTYQDFKTALMISEKEWKGNEEQQDLLLLINSGATAAAAPDTPVSLDKNNVCSNPRKFALLDMAMRNELDLTRFVLIVLYRSLNGDNWPAKRGWLTGDSVCDWDRVWCRQPNNESSSPTIVDRLDLTTNSLSGQIPTEIGHLVNLTSLSLGVDRGLTGTIPSEIGYLTHLSILNLHRSGLTGIIPTQIGNMLSLKTLSLRENKLVGTFPHEVEYLSRLESLDFSQNRIVGGMPTIIGRLTALREVRMENIEFDPGAIPEAITALPRLAFLNVAGTQREGEIDVDSFLKSNTIEGLHLGDNGFTGTLSTKVGLLTNLSVLDISNNFISGTLPAEMGNMTMLHEFALINNKFTGTVPSQLGNCPLTVLLISFNFFRGDLSQFCQVREKSHGIENLVRAEDLEQRDIDATRIHCACCFSHTRRNQRRV